MAENREKLKKTPIIEYIPAEYADEELSDEEIAFNKFREEFTESDSYAKISVFRQPTGAASRPGQRKLTFLFECGVDEFTYSQLLSKLRDEYGTGTYRLQGRDAAGKMLFNRSVDIEQAKKSAAQQAESASEIMESMQKMFQGVQERTEAMIARFGRAQATPPPDAFAMFEKFATMLATLGVFGKQAPQNDLLGEIEKLVKLKTLVSDLGVGGTSDNGAESNFYDLAGKLVDRFGPAFASAVAMKAAQAPARLPAPSAPSAPSAPIAPSAPGNAKTEPVAQASPQASPQAQGTASMKSQLAILVSNAEKGVRPEMMAETILNLTTEEMLDSLYTYVAAPTCIDSMIALNPKVATHREWFERLRARLIQELQPEPDDDTLASEN